MPGAGTNGAPGIKPMHGLTSTFTAATALQCTGLVRTAPLASSPCTGSDRSVTADQPPAPALVNARTVHPLLVDDALILRLRGAGDRQGSVGAAAASLC